MQRYFDKWKICRVEGDILRIKTNIVYKFNTWVVPCFSEAICIAHNKINFESIIIDRHILLSSYMYQPIFIDLLKLHINDDNTHLIVPIYLQNECHISRQDKLDCGISINGKCKEDESYFDTMKREIAEEVGILVDKSYSNSILNSISGCKFDEKFGMFYARDCKPYNSKDEIKFSNKEDCPRRKTYSYIIGSLDECKNLVQNSRELYPSNEFNYGVAIIPINSVLNQTYISKIVYNY